MAPTWDREYELLKEIVRLQKKFAEQGFLHEASELKSIANEFNDRYLIILPQE